MSDSLAKMDQDIARDAEILRANKRVLQVLKKLPDDDARRRVIVAAAALHGLVESVTLREPA